MNNLTGVVCESASGGAMEGLEFPFRKGADLLGAIFDVESWPAWHVPN